jgi:hypothetical protein
LSGRRAGEPARFDEATGDADSGTTQASDVDAALFEGSEGGGFALAQQGDEQVDGGRFHGAGVASDLSGAAEGVADGVAFVVGGGASGFSEHFSIEPTVSEQFGGGAVTRSDSGKKVGCRDGFTTCGCDFFREFADDEHFVVRGRNYTHEP